MHRTIGRHCARTRSEQRRSSRRQRGAGVDVWIGEARDKQGRSKGDAFVSIGILVLWGEDGKYPAPGPHELEAGRPVFRTVRTATTLIVPYVGISFALEGAS